MLKDLHRIQANTVPFYLRDLNSHRSWFYRHGAVVLVSTGSAGRGVPEPFSTAAERGMALLRKGARLAEPGLNLYIYAE